MIIKPHIITEGYTGQIIDSVLSSGFEVSALEMFWLDRPSTEVNLLLMKEFLEVYKNVVPEYSSLVEEMTNGPCVALEIRQDNVVQKLR